MPILLFFPQIADWYGTDMSGVYAPPPCAWDFCFAVTGKGRARKGVRPVEAKSWPGTNRGWGPITSNIKL